MAARRRCVNGLKALRATETRTMGVGDSGMGCERSGRDMFVNAVELIRYSGCASGGMPGTGLDASEPAVSIPAVLEVVAAVDARRTLAAVGTGGSRWAEDTASRVLSCSFC